jgi:general secretion pathway protein J
MTTRRSHSLSGVAGFTLLEALIATALMATILAALATITAQWLPNWNRGMARVQYNEQLALGLERAVADLAAAESISVRRDSRQPLFDGAEHAVIFVRTTLNPNAGPGLEIVRIAEVSGERGPILLRTRAPFLPVTSGVNDRYQPNFKDPIVLMRAPVRLSLSYAGPDRIWRATWQREVQLPKVVKFTLHDAVTQRPLSVSTATVIHSELPAECIAAKSLAQCFDSRQRGTETTEDRDRGQNAVQLR